MFTLSPRATVVSPKEVVKRRNNALQKRGLPVSLGQKREKFVAMAKNFQNGIKNPEHLRVIHNHRDASRPRAGSAIVSTKVTKRQGNAALLYDQEINNVWQIQTAGHRARKGAKLYQ